MHSFLHLKSASRVGILCPTPLPGMDTCRIHTVPVHAQVQVLYTVYEYSTVQNNSVVQQLFNMKIRWVVTRNCGPTLAADCSSWLFVFIPIHSVRSRKAAR